MCCRWLIGTFLSCAAAAADSTWLPTISDLEVPSKQEVAAWFPAEAPVPGILRHGKVSAFLGARAIGGEASAGLGLAYQFGLRWSGSAPSALIRPVISWHHAEASGEHPGPPRDVSLGVVQLRGFSNRDERDLMINEIAVGGEHEWPLGPIQLVAGAGGAWTHVQVDERQANTILRQLLGEIPQERRDTAARLGGWAELAVQYPLGAGAIGAEVRYTYARMSVFDEGLDAGGLQFGASASLCW